ncbi:hypothetical protein BDZ94DRAFT_1313277 [Collybia nuda]|uniref:Uncharacterized protein n=1 Tax=Collybia nuda TaxID=64659 RepID=A0A9P5XVE4_9AGAR|nr:hypothetical protein BDZ94DRAFT_1313277 [Collybia nuda]
MAGPSGISKLPSKGSPHSSNVRTLNTRCGIPFRADFSFLPGCDPKFGFYKENLLNAQNLSTFSSPSSICSASFLLDEDITKKFSSHIASTIADKVTLSLSNTPESLATSAKFLEANTTQQALLASATSNLAKLVTKFSTIQPALPPAPQSWASVASSTPPPPSPLFNLNTPPQQTQLQQCILTAAHLVIVEVDTNNPNAIKDKSPQALNEICKAMNDVLAKLNELESTFLEDGEHKICTSIQGIQVLDSNTLHFELDSPKAANSFKLYVSDPDENIIKTHIGPTACIKS